MTTQIRDIASEHEIHQFVAHFAKEIGDNNAAIFAGAGLSVASGYVDWKELMRSIAKELRLDVDLEENLIAMAQYHENERLGNRARLNQLLIDEFTAGHEVNDNHRILARLPIATYWTTNYDRLIETALQEAAKVADVKFTVEQLAATIARRDAIVYKMHGDVEHASQAVLTKDDYEKYHVTRGAYINLLTGDLVSKTFLFLGFSFTDPNIDYILARVRATWSKNQRAHYCVARAIQRWPKEKQSQFAYRKLKQHYFIKDLARFNIHTILVRDYSDVTAILRRIENTFKSKTVFISGSAHEYGLWGQQQSESFLAELSAALIRRDQNVVTGFGLGVGSAVVSGALNQILTNRKKHTMGQMIMRPFPQTTGVSGRQLRDLWSAYRKEMASYAGVLIIVFGNKREGEKIVPADGVEEEFRIACDLGLRPIPVGSTGYMAESLHARVLGNFEKYHPNGSRKLRRLLESLGDKRLSPKHLIRRILESIDALQRG